MGQSDFEVECIADGDDKGNFGITAQGFDYYNTRIGNVDPGGANQNSLWMFDPSYDGRSLFSRRVFFWMAGAKESWAKLTRSPRTKFDLALIEAYRGSVLLLFEVGNHGQAAVKIVDDRGIESLKVVA